MENPVTINLADGGLGSGKDAIDGLHLKIGVAEDGDANTIYSMSSEKAGALRFIKGALVDSLERHFLEGGKRCFAMRPTNDVAGSLGAVTHTGTGTAVGAVSGTPTGARNFVVQIVAGGAFGTATYRWSEDGGVTWSSIYTTPVSGTVISLAEGVSITFTGTDSAFVAGDEYSFSSVAPSASVTSFLAAIDAALAQYNKTNYPYRWIHIVGGFDRTFWESVKAKCEDFEEAKIFISFVLEYPAKADSVDVDDYLLAMVDEGNLFSSKRVAVVGSRLKYGDDDDYKSAAILLCAQLSAHRVNIHPGWVKECASVTATEIQYWDELKDYAETLDDANIIIACQYQNWDGIFIKKDHLMSPSDSDFQTIHDLRPADKLRFLAYEKIMPFVNSNNSEGDNAGIESLIAELDVAISQEMEKPGEMEISGHEVDIDSSQDLSDGELEGKIHMYKTDTMEKITIDVGYSTEE